jgi:hypothetical protein
MTIDERLERLTERHEALTQTVELLARTTHEHSQQITEIMEATARLLHICADTRTAPHAARRWRAMIGFPGLPRRCD